MPCLVEFSREAFLPACVLGPVDFLALARLAANWRGERGFLLAFMWGFVAREASFATSGLGKSLRRTGKISERPVNGGCSPDGISFEWPPMNAEKTGIG
jgi:hypothetical protein